MSDANSNKSEIFFENKESMLIINKSRHQVYTGPPINNKIKFIQSVRHKEQSNGFMEISDLAGICKIFFIIGLNRFCGAPDISIIKQIIIVVMR